jgi:hypothetical protein
MLTVKPYSGKKNLARENDAPIIKNSVVALRKHSRVSLSFKILQIPSWLMIFKRVLIFFNWQVFSFPYLFFWTFGADLRYLGGETPFLLKTSASEAKHKYRGQPVNMKSQRYVKLWEVFLAFLFVVSSLNSDACFSKWFKACLSWKVQHQ